MPATKNNAKYLIDAYGLREVFTNGDNVVRSTVISQLESGELRIMRSSSNDLKDIDEDAYADFQASVGSKKYIKTLIKHETLRASLMTKYGASIFGRSPSEECFEAMAICLSDNLTFVTHGKALNGCNKIVKGCKLKDAKVLSLPEFANGFL
jgi:hypothetical protein